MKHLAKIIGMAALLGISSITSAAELNLTVTNIQKAEGSLYIRIYDTSSKWLSQDKDGPRATQVVDLTSLKDAKDITKTIELPVGTYAATVIHDVNNNGILDKNWMGMPTEPTGETGKGEEKKGPPAFADCTFEITGSTQKTIRLINY